MKVVFHYDCGAWLEERLGTLAAHGIEATACPPDDEAAFRACLPRIDAIWHVLKPVTAETLEAAPRLKLVQKIGVGVNTIDLAACRERGVAVCNMPGTNTRAVAEMTLGLMLAARRRLATFDAALKADARWTWPVERQALLGEIGGARVGLVGFGAVPRALAPVLAAMGAEVVWTGRAPRNDVPYPFLDKRTLLSTADVVSLHVPETPETAGWLDAAAIAAMKPGAILVNTARGGLVDEAALVEALRSGHLAAAGLDVFAVEPVSADNALLVLDNVVLAPHVAWFTRETLERSLAVAVENCRRLSAGEPLLHRVA